MDRTRDQRNARRAAATAWVIIALLALAGGVAGCSSTDSDAPATSSTSASPDSGASADPDLPAKEVLERQKLAAEVRAIEAQVRDEASSGSQFLRWAPFLTVLVASATLLFTVAKDRREARSSREKERVAQGVETRKRHDEAIATTVQNMGSDSVRLRLNAAAALAPVIRDPEDPHVAVDLLPVLVANLRNETDGSVIDVLVRDLELTLRQLESHGELPTGLDLTRTRIRRLRIPGLPLRDADIAFAELLNCDLSGCDARRLRGYQTDLTMTRLSRANLHEARLNMVTAVKTQFHLSSLVSATLKGANLTGAQFHQARLQGAHFENAYCAGTIFTEANVADTWFCDSSGQNAAVFDETSLRSLTRSHNWTQAHFSDETWQALNELSG